MGRLFACFVSEQVYEICGKMKRNFSTLPSTRGSCWIPLEICSPQPLCPGLPPFEPAMLSIAPFRKQLPWSSASIYSFLLSSVDHQFNQLLKILVCEMCEVTLQLFLALHFIIFLNMRQPSFQYSSYRFQLNWPSLYCSQSKLSVANLGDPYHSQYRLVITHEDRTPKLDNSLPLPQKFPLSTSFYGVLQSIFQNLQPFRHESRMRQTEMLFPNAAQLTNHPNSNMYYCPPDHTNSKVQDVEASVCSSKLRRV